jgi:hypothetical protein
MRATCLLSLVASSIISQSAMAAPVCPPGRLATRTGPTGITLQICLDGRYATCRRDGLRLGWPAEQAKSFCDRRLADGRLK